LFGTGLIKDSVAQNNLAGRLALKNKLVIVSTAMKRCATLKLTIAITSNKNINNPVQRHLRQHKGSFAHSRLSRLLAESAALSQVIEA